MTIKTSQTIWRLPGVGVREATLVVAASDSSPQSKAQADYVCDGVDDQVEIQAAIDALPADGGKVVLLEGLYIKSNIPGISIPSNVKIELLEGAMIKLKDAVDSGAVIFKNSALWIVDMNISITGGTLDGNKANQGATDVNTAIDFNSVRYCKVDTKIVNFRGYNIRETKTRFTRGNVFINRAYPLSTPLEVKTEHRIQASPNLEVIDNFETGWTTGSGVNWAVAYDTTTKFRGNSSLRFTSTDGTIARSEKTGLNLNLANRSARFRIKIDDKDKLARLDFFLGGWHAPYYSWFNFFDSAERDWYILTLPLSGPTGNAHWVESYDFSSINKLMIQIKSKAGQTVNVWVDALEAVKKIGPLVTFTFDDGHDTDYTQGMRILDKYGFAGVSFVIPNEIGEPNRLTIAQLQEMQAKGWDISNHTMSHPNLSLLSEAEAEDEIRGAQDFLLAHGLSKGARFIAYPGGALPANLELVSRYNKFGRAIFFFNSSSPMNVNPYALETVGADGLTAAELKSHIDRAIEYKGWLIFVIHRIGTGAGELTPANLEAAVAHAHSRGVRVVTFSEVYELMFDIVRLTPTSDLFMDVRAASATHVHPAITPDGLAHTDVTSPDVPRNTMIRITNTDTVNAQTPSGGNIDIEGVDARGNSASETLVVPATSIPAGGTSDVFGNKPFATVSKATYYSETNTAITVSVGISDKLGLSNVIYTAGDVFKVKKGTDDIPVGAVDVINGTVDCAPIANGNDFTIYYRSNLNILT